MKFVGKISGDNECFCWEVSEETYREVCDERLYKIELELREDDEYGLFKDKPWRIYPSDVLPKYYKEMTFTIEAHTNEEVGNE